MKMYLTGADYRTRLRLVWSVARMPISETKSEPSFTQLPAPVHKLFTQRKAVLVRRALYYFP